MRDAKEHERDAQNNEKCTLEKLERLTETLHDLDKDHLNYIKALETAIKISHQGFWVWNIKTGHLFLTWDWANNLGYSQNELPPNVSTWESLCHPYDLEKAKALLRDHWETKGSTRYDLPIRYKKKMGGFRVLRSFGETAVWENGEPLIMVGIVEPIK